jgi:hypothetical protein
VAGSIAGSHEYHRDEAQAQYQNLLQRPADDGGLAGLTALLDQGGNLEQVQAQLAGSDEYFQKRGGGTVDGFIDALYHDALQRGADPGGKASIEGQLAGGASRTQVADLLFGSDEARGLRVAGLYQQLLHRPGDAAAISGWVSALDHGLSDAGLIAGFAGSREYFDGKGQGSDVAWIGFAYHDVLGRDPSADEIKTWLGLLG